MSRSGNQGVYEWADKSINIQIGCEHNCRYCYARHRAVDRFGYCKSLEAWKTPKINQKNVDRGIRKNYGTVMFPSTHDITPANISEYLCVLRKILDAGNNVLVVTKPHLDCIKVICEGYKRYREQILFRFTIGSCDDEILSFWEPGAANFAERLSCLQYAYKSGYKTSVSCEPYLDPYVVYTYMACKPFVTDSFWVGKMRGINSRVRLDGATEEDKKRFVTIIQAAQCDGVVRSIYRLLDGHKFIQWKDSIREVIGI